MFDDDLSIVSKRQSILSCARCRAVVQADAALQSELGFVCLSCEEQLATEAIAPRLSSAWALSAVGWSIVLTSYGCSARSRSESSWTMDGITDHTVRYGLDGVGLVFGGLAVVVCLAALRAALVAHRREGDSWFPAVRVAVLGVAGLALLVGMARVWDARPHRVTHDLTPPADAFRPFRR